MMKTEKEISKIRMTEVEVATLVSSSQRSGVEQSGHFLTGFRWWHLNGR